ncbi:MAG: 2-C-methyl-D-erythritol 2,4-cyclodiphosphate synthase [Candidatus Omnitrophota bacterium]
MPYRIGFGWDIHRLIDGRKLFLGGVEVPYIKGLLGHSDADVLLHAICDALLGALALGDIGEHFPDTDARYRNVPSSELLKLTFLLVKKESYRVVNIDTVIIAQEPVITPFKKSIRQNIAGLLGLSENCLSIKAKTNEGIGEIGRKEAIAAYAVALLEKGE